MEENISNTDVCRACLTQQGEFRSVFNLAESVDVDIRIAEMITAYTFVQITFGDGLPEQICISCTNKAIEMYKFKKQCEESDIALRKKLGKSPLLKILSDHNDKAFPRNFAVDINETELLKPEICNVNNLKTESQYSEAYEYVEVSHKNIDLLEPAIYECEQCLLQFTEEVQFNHHIKNHERKLLPCHLCLKVFVSEDDMLKHQLTHSLKSDENSLNDETALATESFPEIELKSDLSSTCTSDEMNLSKLCGAQKKKDLECFVCNRRFEKARYLAVHLRTHNPNDPHACAICNKRFPRMARLMKHMNTHKPHVCDICFKGFNQKTNLKDHIRTHNGEKPFLCSTCGKGFNQMGNLRQHIIRHAGIKTHVCTFCGNSFASKGELSSHIRSHTGARPFICPVCNRGFTTSSSLTKHKRIHSGEKPYECDVCHMRFYRSGILARHKRTHTGEKPYVCRYCNKAFSQSNDLSSHLRIHTGERPYTCDTCGCTFRQSSVLKTHKKIHTRRSTNSLENGE